MTTLIAEVEFSNIAIAFVIGAGIGWFCTSHSKDLQVDLLSVQVRELQKKLDAILEHQGIEMPPPPASGLSQEVELLASDVRSKIAAIKLYRQDHPEVSLREAKERIEAFYKSKQ